MVDTVDDPLVVQDPIATPSIVRIPVLRCYEDIYLCSAFYRQRANVLRFIYSLYKYRSDFSSADDTGPFQMPKPILITIPWCSLLLILRQSLIEPVLEIL